MNDAQFREWATAILWNLQLEKTGWRAWFERWVISAEPLRHDAANLLHAAGFRGFYRRGTRPLVETIEEDDRNRG